MCYVRPGVLFLPSNLAMKTLDEVDHVSSCESNHKAVEFIARNYNPRVQLGNMLHCIHVSHQMKLHIPKVLSRCVQS